MDIRVLKYFLTVARERNITKAAEILHIAQPSLSKQLMDLENELGKKLFIRGKRGVTLTETGTLLSKRAEEIIEIFEKTEKEITADFETVGGIISIGGSGSILVTETASSLAGKYPEIHYDFFSCDAEEVMERLDNGTLDFGILIDCPDVLKYDYIPLPEKNLWGLLMKADSPLAKKTCISPKDIEKLPLIIPKRTGIRRELSRWFGQDILNLNIVAQFNLFYNSTVMFVKSGLGYGVTLERLTYIGKNDELCFRSFEPKMEIQHYIIWKKYRTFSKAAEKFIDELKKGLAK